MTAPVFRDITVKRSITPAKDAGGRPVTDSEGRTKYVFIATIEGTRKGAEEPNVTLVTCWHVVALDDHTAVAASEASEEELAKAFYRNAISSALPPTQQFAADRVERHARGEVLDPAWRLPS